MTGAPLPELEIDDLPMSIDDDGKLIFSTEGRHFFYVKASLSISAEDTSDWQIDDIALAMDDKTKTGWRTRHLDIPKPLYEEFLSYFIDHYPLQIRNHVATQLPLAVEAAQEDNAEFNRGLH
jgi:hypothetical protein